MTAIHDVEIASSRRILCFLLFSGYAILYALRVNLSVAIVAMTTNSQILRHFDSDGDYCPVPKDLQDIPQNNPKITKMGDFDWNEKTQGFMLGSFFWGYMLTNLIGGLLAEKFGGRLVFGLGTFMTSFLTLLSPLAAWHSTTAFVIIRILEGMTEGVTFPAMNVLMAHWVLPTARSSFLSTVMSGASVGTVVTLSVTGWLCASSFGWPAAFVLFGAIGFVWTVFWFLFVSDEPPVKLFAITVFKDDGFPTPWSCILRSRPFLCAAAAHTAGNFGFYCLLTEIPTYLAHALHLDVRNSGLVSSLPYIARGAVLLLYSSWLDHAVQAGTFSLLTARRLSGIIGLAVPGCLLMCVSLVGCSTVSVVTLLVFAVAAAGADHCGPLCAYQDLSPRHAGALSGLSNTFATLPGFLAPLLTGYLTQDQSSLNSWRQVFLVTSVLYWLGAFVYYRHVSVLEQPWSTVATARKSDDAGRAPFL